MFDNISLIFIQDHNAANAAGKKTFTVNGNEMLKNNQPVNAKQYPEPMNVIKEIIQLEGHDQRYNVIKQHDNA